MSNKKLKIKLYSSLCFFRERVEKCLIILNIHIFYLKMYFTFCFQYFESTRKLFCLYNDYDSSNWKTTTTFKPFQSKYNIEKYCTQDIVKMLTNVIRMLPYNCFSCIIGWICCAGWSSGKNCYSRSCRCMKRKKNKNRRMIRRERRDYKLYATRYTHMQFGHAFYTCKCLDTLKTLI